MSYHQVKIICFKDGVPEVNDDAKALLTDEANSLLLEFPQKLA